MRKDLLLNVVIILLSATLLAGCGNSEAKTGTVIPQRAVSASVIRLAPQSFQAILPITGALVSNARLEVKAEVVGRVMRFDKEEGDHVSANEPVIWVDDEDYVLALRQAEAAVKVADAGVKRAHLLESHSRAELERAGNLLNSGGITDKDMKSAQLADHDARAQNALAEAQLDQALASLDVARKRVRDTIIRAPIAGEIERKQARKGAYVETSTPVFTVVDNSRLEIESSVASADLAAIQKGQRVTFHVNSYPGIQFEGNVIDIGPALDDQTRTAKVRIQVANAAGKLKAGMFMQGELFIGVRDSAIVIPVSAVYRNDRSEKSSYVFVLENGKASRRNVRIGWERDSVLEVVQGLKPGDLLIAEQNIEIAEGARIEARR